MQKLYRLVQVITFAVLLIIQNSLQAQNCCLDCQSDVKVITNNKVLLEKIDLKEGTSTTLNTNLYVSYRSGNAQKFWANLAIATAGVAVSTQLNSSPITAGDSKTQSAISPIVPLGVSVATLPGIWKNRPRGVPNTKIEIQHKDVEGNILKTWTQAISKSARNDAELLNVALNEPLSKGTVEISLVNESKNSVYYWGYEDIKQVIENQNSIFKTPDVLALNETKSEPSNLPNISNVFALSGLLPKKNDGFSAILRRPKTPIWINNDGGCPGGEHIGNDGNCQPDGPDLNEVTITPPPPPPPPPAPWVPTNDPTNDPNNNGNNGNTNPNGTYNNTGGGGGNSGGNNNDAPQTRNKGFQFDLLKGDGSFTGNFLTPVVTSYESGTLFRPNSQSPWRFQSFSFSNIGISGRLLFEVWTASSLNAISNINSDGSYASMNHTWQLVRSAALGEIIIPGASSYTTHFNYYGYSPN
jgi:hypothetical protein